VIWLAEFDLPIRVCSRAQIHPWSSDSDTSCIAATSRRSSEVGIRSSVSRRPRRNQQKTHDHHSLSLCGSVLTVPDGLSRHIGLSSGDRGRSSEIAKTSIIFGAMVGAKGGFLARTGCPSLRRTPGWPTDAPLYNRISGFTVNRASDTLMR